jgi:hypothetical protein
MAKWDFQEMKSVLSAAESLQTPERSRAQRTLLSANVQAGGT